MKILLLSDYAYPAGGAEHMVLRLRDGLRARGHDARVLSTDIEPVAGQNFADYRCAGTTSGARTLLQTANPWAASLVRRVLAEFDPDIVHVRMFLSQLSALILKPLRGRRALYHLAWYRAICPTGRKALPDQSPCTQTWGRACLDNRCVPKRDWPLLMHQLHSVRRNLNVFRAVIANSGHVRDVMARDGIASDVIYNGVPIPALLDAPKHAEPTVLYAGRLTPEKGCQTLLEAMEAVLNVHPSAHLRIAGDGPFRAELEARSRQGALANRVLFLGHLSQDDLRRETRRAWLQAAPSLWDEPFGIAALDAMVQACPVVASAAGGLAEIVVDGVTGFLTPPGDAPALAQQIAQILGDPILAGAMGAAGRARAAGCFSMNRCVEDFLTLYARLMAEPATVT